MCHDAYKLLELIHQISGFAGICHLGTVAPGLPNKPVRARIQAVDVVMSLAALRVIRFCVLKYTVAV